MRIIQFLTAIAVTGILMSSCENDDTPTPSKPATPKASDYYPMKAGNYWVYEMHETHPDSNSEYARYMGRDSIHVMGTQIFANDTFWKVSYNSTFSNQKDQYKYYKDSAGYLIEKPGIRKLSFDNYSDTLFSYAIKGSNNKDFVLIRRYMKDFGGTINTPAGNFDSLINLEQAVYLTRPNNYDDYPRVYKNLYAKGIGKVYYEFGYIGGKALNECRLIKYKVD